MQLGVKLRPSKTKGDYDPGHMGVYWKKGDGLEFRGYRFRVEDLPDDYQDSSQWRNYLFENRVPGYVVDDIILRDDYEHRKDSLLERNWAMDDEKEPALESQTEPRSLGYYSFNPDANRCHNCVTWATETVNGMLGEVLPRVREGRIKLIQAHLEQS